MPLPDLPILVTGGAGLIGSNLIAALNATGREDIIVVDILGSDQRWKNLVPLRFADYLEADQLFAHLESDRLRAIGTIFHLGACSATTETDSSYLIRNNYEFTRTLAGWALAGTRRFVYASSAATYGDGSAGMEDGESGIERYRPLNMYGYSKHLFDLHARSRGWLTQIAGLKYFNVYGPGEEHKGDMRSVVHKAFAQIKQKGSVQLFKSEHPDYPDGGQKRDFFYVKDAVQATIHLAANPNANGLYNLGSGQASTWLELVTPIFEELGLPVKVDFIDLPAPLRGKYQYYTCADTTRLQATGWGGPTYTLGSAVRDYVRNLLLTPS